MLWPAFIQRPRVRYDFGCLKSMESAGEFCDVSQSTISRAVSVLTPLARAAAAAHVPDDTQIAAAAADRIVLVDGTLAPVWSWRGHQWLYSGKHRRTGFNL